MKQTSQNHKAKRQRLAKSQSTSQKQSTKQLRILDYRNGKYQGFTSNKSMARNGLGILIDDNYSFLVSDWKQNEVEGPFMAVYPDESILYGYMENKKIGEMACYFVNKQLNMILSKNSNLIIVDLLPSNTILTLKIDSKILNENTAQSILQLKQSRERRQQIDSSLSLLSQQYYSNEQQKIKIYKKRLSISSIPEYLKDYEHFIKHHFNTQNQHKELVQISKTKQDLTISFKQSSITLFIKLFLDSNLTKILGSMNRYQNQYQFYKRTLHSSNSIEEVVKKQKMPFSIQYNLKPYIRPKKCEIQLKNFHKSSVTYINNITNIQYVYTIKQSLQKIQQLINSFITTKMAQIQLQNSLLNQQQQKNIKINRSPNINYKLSQVQQQIYNAVKRKQLKGGRSTILGKSRSRIIQGSNVVKRSFDQYPKSNDTNLETNFRNNNSPYVRALQNDSSFQNGRLNRSKTFTNISNVTKNYDFFLQQGKKEQRKKGKNNSTTKKYSYLDESQLKGEKSRNKGQNVGKYDGFSNIKRLTEDYENIKKQIELSTPKDKGKQIGYGIKTYKIKEDRLNNSVYRKTPHTAYKVSQDSYIPVSQRKVFKYLPN